MRWLRRVGIGVGALVLLLVLWLAAALVVYPSEYVWRIVTWGESQASYYIDRFPKSTLTAAAEPAPFDVALDEDRVGGLLEAALGVDDLDTFLTTSDTQALIVVHDDAVVYEGYANGAGRDAELTAFSVAKSFDSALVGIAIDEGFIASVDDPVTTYLPELAERDPRFADVTIRDLLMMSSGFGFREMRWFVFNGDGPLTSYHPDQREISLTNTHVVDPPGTYFQYDKYHPQLLGMILERTTGMSVTAYTQTRLWDPMGMEYDGAWALDSERSGFEKMEAGLNARAIDYAKLGRLFLHGGAWGGTQVVPAAWVEESTALDPSRHDATYYSRSFGPSVYDDGRGYYAYFWYGRLRDGAPADIRAEGDRGQIIYVSPAHDVVIVRIGTDFGIPMGAWTDAFAVVAEEL